MSGTGGMGEMEECRSPEFERLAAQVNQLRTLQAVAEDAAALHGMTTKQALEYKRRHYQLRELMRELVEQEMCKAGEQGGRP